jgi:hypothetical protein
MMPPAETPFTPTLEETVMTTRRAASLLGLLLALIMCPTALRAETTNCTAVTTVPAVISTPGVYCLTGNLVTNMASGNAIDIQANNVVLDLNGFRVAGLAAGAGTQARGIYSLNHQNITIKNGIVRGFLVGIFLEGSSGQGHLVEDILADLNTMVGIGIGGHRSIVRNNRIVSTGGGTGAPFALGIIIDGSGNRVINNDIMNVFHPASQAAGISFEGFANVDSLAVGNRITAAPAGIAIEGTGKYQGNLTSGVSMPYIGGTDAGNNN